MDVADIYMYVIFRNFRHRMERIPVRTDHELSALTMPLQVMLGGKDDRTIGAARADHVSGTRGSRAAAADRDDSDVSGCGGARLSTAAVG